MTTANFLIRNAIPSDAKYLNRYLRSIFAESRHLVTKPEEFKMTPFQQRVWIKRKAANTHEICIVALHGKSILGVLESATDRRARTRHVTTFSMSVHPDHRGKGIGQELLNTYTGWVSEHNQLSKVELHVHSDNAIAIHLYEKAGFVIEGRRKDAIKYKNERFVDDILMAYWPNSSNVEINMEQ
ncbi:GNAT family N-acetyltransferase [Kordiimonas aquimaris]|uniref:GNAT family N-acetyltransferase n=1 Tax=Kordiimonas aquimaris TaxID=707591 RepID=UPI0021D26CC9|nr:GNAT family N-acetyltransferase [Kordiimonas aquimaris]